MSVINKVSEASCCGCGACVAVCQRHCLQMKQDNNGWFRPLLSLRACNECGLCESVCPVLAPKTLREQSENVFAAKAKSKSIRIKSSSGGVFATALCPPVRVRVGFSMPPVVCAMLPTGQSTSRHSAITVPTNVRICGLNTFLTRSCLPLRPLLSRWGCYN